MKLLVALLLVFCLVGSAYSSCYNTLKSLSGYSTGTYSIGYNVDIDGKKVSYIENALMDVDFATQQIHYNIMIVQPTGQPISYELFVYGQNNTQYISINGGACYLEKLSEPIPTSLPVTPATQNLILGDIQTETYIIKTNSTNQYLNVNPSTCAMLVAMVSNTDDDFGGSTIFTNYSTKVAPSSFTLPASCYNASPIQKEHTHKLKTRYQL